MGGPRLPVFTSLCVCVGGQKDVSEIHEFSYSTLVYN